MKTYNDMRDHDPEMSIPHRSENDSRDDWRCCRTCKANHHKDDMTTICPPDSFMYWLCEHCALRHFKDRCEALSALLGKMYGLASCEIRSGSAAWRRAAEEIKEVLHG